MANEMDDYYQGLLTGYGPGWAGAVGAREHMRAGEADFAASMVTTPQASAPSGPGLFDELAELGSSVGAKIPLLGRLQDVAEVMAGWGWKVRVPGAFVAILVTVAALGDPAVLASLRDFGLALNPIELASPGGLFAIAIAGWLGWSWPNLVALVLSLIVGLSGLALVAVGLAIVYVVVASLVGWPIPGSN